MPGNMSISIESDEKVYIAIETEGSADVSLGKLLSSANDTYLIKVEDQDFKGFLSISNNQEVNILVDYTENIIKQYELDEVKAQIFRERIANSFGDKEINGSLKMLGSVSLLMSCK
jgi:hypothetical protein